MASPKKVRWAELRVGVLITIALAIAGLLIFLLTGQGNLFEGDFHVRTYLDDSAGMVENSPVRLNGILVGHIGKVTLSGDRNPKRTVQLDMVIQEKFLSQIPDDSKAAIAAANILGEKYIDITRGNHPKHVQPGGEIEAVETQDIPEMIAQSSKLLNQFQTILGRVDTLLAVVETGQGNIGKLIKDDTLYDRVNATAGELQQIVKDIRNSNGTISQLLYDDTLLKDVRRPIQRLDDMLAQVQQAKGSAGKFLYDPQLFDEARDSITEAKQMLDNLNKGQGTAGKLLKDEELYRQLNQIAAKVDSAVEKINSGQGTLGQLVVNPQLYDSLNGTAREVNSLIKDLHANPKKYLTIRLVLF